MCQKENSFLAAVEATIRCHHMIEPGDTVLVGVSGGPDSVALLHSLVAIRANWPVRLAVAHLNHQLRGTTADEEAAFVERLASSLEIPCEIGSKDVKSFSAENRLSIQEAARQLRYAFYDEVAARFGAQKIALGHQANDNAESIIMHLLRGTGPRGLAGIPPVRQGRIIRPLIDINRKQILGFLKRRGVKHLQDDSNDDPKYLRNRIRHGLLPSLEGHFNPKIILNLGRLASILRDEEDLWDKIVGDSYKNLVLVQTADRITLSNPGLARLHPALLRRLIRHTVLSLRNTLKGLGHNHVEAVARLIGRPTPSGWLDLPQGLGVMRDREEVTFLIGRLEERPHFEYRIDGIGATFIQEINTMLKLSTCGFHDVFDKLGTYPPTTAFFDLKAVSFPLVVRNFEKGDRFTPMGMSGSQKVKDYFINHRISQAKKRQCLMLLSGGRIIWVGGHRIDDSAKITKDTEKVLVAELLPA
jgi:tRNA(Ile)-lysidine synthase